MELITEKGQKKKGKKETGTKYNNFPVPWQVLAAKLSEITHP